MGSMRTLANLIHPDSFNAAGLCAKVFKSLADGCVYETAFSQYPLSQKLDGPCFGDLGAVDYGLGVPSFYSVSGWYALCRD